MTSNERASDRRQTRGLDYTIAAHNSAVLYTRRDRETKTQRSPQYKAARGLYSSPTLEALLNFLGILVVIPRNLLKARLSVARERE